MKSLKRLIIFHKAYIPHAATEEWFGPIFMSFAVDVIGSVVTPKRMLV